MVPFASLGAIIDPLVSVSVNDSAEAQVFRGMPLLVSITFVSPTALSANSTPILLGSAVGSWTNSVRLEVLDASKNLQAWPFNLSTVVGDTITLDETGFARLDRWLTPQQTMPLSKGNYSLVATIDTTGVTLLGAWRGTAESTPATLELLDEPAVLTKAQAENKYSQLALYELFLQNGEKALSRINQLLASFPNSLTGLRIKVLALEAVGRIVEAQTICEQAIQKIYARNPAPQESPDSFLILRRQLEQSLLSPALQISRSNERQVALDWPGHSGLSYLLESSADLSSWSFFRTNFNLSDQRYSLTVPAQDNHQFFRLSASTNSTQVSPP